MILLWVKKQWKWLLAGLALLAAFLIGFFSRRPKVLTPSSDVQNKERELEEEAEEKKQEALEERDEEITKITKWHDEETQELKEEQEDRYEELKDDPEALTAWLKSVGKAQQ